MPEDPYEHYEEAVTVWRPLRGAQHILDYISAQASENGELTPSQAELHAEIRAHYETAITIDFRYWSWDELLAKVGERLELVEHILE